MSIIDTGNCDHCRTLDAPRLDLVQMLPKDRRTRSIQA
jgi:hypothetical protein